MCVRVFLGVAILLNYVDFSGTESRIVGGDTANEGQFPHQVSLRVKNRHGCGGSILNPTTILTAAHCVHTKFADDLTVVAGSSRLDKGGHHHKVRDIIVHDDFNPRKFLNDIAVLKLRRPLKFGDHVQPVRLATRHLDPDEPLTLSGWGKTVPGESASRYLQFIDLRPVELGKCSRKLRNRNPIMRGHICAASYYGSGYGACKGDSGGPLINREEELVGVTSWGVPCAKGYPDVFTDVYHHRERDKFGIIKYPSLFRLPQLYQPYRLCRKFSDDLTVVAGTNRLDKGGSRHGVDDIIVHEDYEKYRNDIAVLKLRKPLELDDKIKPIRLASRPVESGETLTLSGWGRTALEDGLSDELLYVKLRSVGRKKCHKILGRRSPIVDGHVCALSALGEGYGACKGDSGGPLINGEGELVGLTSWGVGCARGLPDVYTDVYHFRGWIKNEL